MGSSYPKIPEPDYRKCVGQFRLQLNDVFAPLRQYGQGIYVDGAIEEVVELTEMFAMRVRGKAIPIRLKNRRNSR